MSIPERKTLITGLVERIEKAESKRGNAYFKMEVAPMGERFGEYDSGSFEVVATGDAAKVAAMISQGDHVQLECAVTASEWKGRTFINLAMADLLHREPASARQGAEATDMEPVGDDDDPMPF